MNEQFIKDLYTNFPNTQIFKLPETKSGWAYAISAKDVDHFNDFKKKNWIFFTPNWDYWKQNWQRKKELAKNIYCFFVDRDDDYEFWKDIDLEPSIVIRTKQWHHAYWLLDWAYPTVDYWKKWSTIMKSLIHEMWWDPQASDLSRIMRLPWTIYWKDKQWDFKIDVIKYNPEIKYKFEDFDIFDKKPKQIENEKKNTKKTMDKDSSSIVDQIDESVDVWQVLENLSWWTWVVKWTIIYEWWEPTNWYKKHPTDNYIINWSNPNIWQERPEGQPFAIAKQMLWWTRKAFEYFKDRYWIGVEQETTNNTEVYEDYITIDSPVGEIEINYWDPKILLYKQDWSSMVVLDWALERLWYYMDESWVVNYLVRYYKKWETWILIGRELGKISEFDRWLSSVGLTFFGWKAVKLQIISFIQSSTEKYNYINSLWIYSKDLIVTHTWQYIKEVRWHKYFIDIKDNNKWFWVWQEVIKIWEKENIKEVLDSLANSYESHIIYTLFTAFAMSIFSHYLRNTFRFAPIVWLVWLTQSGKTSNRRLMNELFWINTDVMETQAGSTEFVVMSLVNHYLPLGIGEYQNDLLRFDWDTFLKNNYDNTQTLRGTPSQTMKKYENNWMLFIDWETRSLNNAVYSRSIMLHFNPRYRKIELPAVDNILLYFINRFDNIYTLKKFFDKNKKELTERYKSLDKQEKNRIIDNYSLLLWFAEAFEFKEKAKDSILKQVDEQFKLMGEDNVDKIIKNISRLAYLNVMPINSLLSDKWYLLKIEFQADTLRISKNKLDDAQSNIILVNNHFFPNSEAPADVLYIPINYMIDNSNLHIYLNNLLDQLVTQKNNIPRDLWNKLKDYARNSWYTQRNFYYYIEEWGFNFEEEDEDFNY